MGRPDRQYPVGCTIAGIGSLVSIKLRTGINGTNAYVPIPVHHQLAILAVKTCSPDKNRHCTPIVLVIAFDPDTYAVVQVIARTGAADIGFSMQTQISAA